MIEYSVELRYRCSESLIQSSCMRSGDAGNAVRFALDSSDDRGCGGHSPDLCTYSVWSEEMSEGPMSTPDLQLANFPPS